MEKIGKTKKRGAEAPAIEETPSVPGRRTRGRPKIARSRIIEAALELIGEEGVQALSMRAVAQRLESGTATLYRHYSGRPELVGDIVDHLLGQTPPIEDGFKGRGWAEFIAARANAMFQVLTRYKGLPALFAEEVPIGPNAMRQRDRFIGVLLGAHFPPHVAALAYATVARFVLGFALQSDMEGDADGRLEEAISELSNGGGKQEYPSLQAVADSLPFEFEEEFDFGLKLILAGLSALRGNA